MNIEYKKNDDNACVTSCPHGQKDGTVLVALDVMKVGSSGCQKCWYHESIDRRKQVVNCKNRGVK